MAFLPYRAGQVMAEPNKLSATLGVERLPQSFEFGVLLAGQAPNLGDGEPGFLGDGHISTRNLHRADQPAWSSLSAFLRLSRASRACSMLASKSVSVSHDSALSRQIVISARSFRTLPISACLSSKSMVSPTP